MPSKFNFAKARLYVSLGLSLGLVLVLAGGMVFFASRLAQNFYKNLTVFLKDKNTLLEQTLSLQEQNRQLQEQILLYQEAGLAPAANELPANATSAKILGFALGSSRGEMFIDKGLRGGVNNGDWVLISQNTLIGRIEEAHNNFSVVKTIFDPSLKIAASLMPQNALGLFSFSKDGFKLDLLPQDVQLQQPATVETSSQDGTFKRGFLLGKAVSLTDSPQYPLKQARVESVFNLNNLTYVIVEPNLFLRNVQ